MALESLAGLAAMLLIGAAVFLFVVWFLLPFMEQRACPHCATKQSMGAEACAVCGQALPGPVQAHPGATPYGYPAPRGPGRGGPRVRVEAGEAFNRGITRRAVTLATAAMGLGIGLRVLGMVGVLGVPQVPPVVDGILTIVGGLVAFVGFVFLDAA
jgi:hypothetical protein